MSVIFRFPLGTEAVHRGQDDPWKPNAAKEVLPEIDHSRYPAWRGFLGAFLETFLYSCRL
jgi:hypothetical protein